MIGVEDRRVVLRLLAAGRRPHQTHLGVEAVGVQAVHERDDRVHVVRARVLAVDAVDVEDAVLVQADVDDVDVPGRERRDHRVVTRAVEDPPTLDAGVLGTRSIDPAELDDLAVAIHQVVARHGNREGGSVRGARRDSGRQDRQGDRQQRDEPMTTSSCHPRPQ